MKPQTRKLFILIHLCLAALFAPVFLLVAISGGLYLVGIEGEVEATELTLPDGFVVNPRSDTVRKDIQEVLAENGLSLDFEMVRGRGGNMQTRPTSRTFVQFRTTPQGIVATLSEPNLAFALMELHKGHGPSWYRLYQQVAALVLCLAVISGVIVGVLLPAYRATTIAISAAGVFLFLFLAFLI